MISPSWTLTIFFSSAQRILAGSAALCSRECISPHRCTSITCSVYLDQQTSPMLMLGTIVLHRFLSVCGKTDWELRLCSCSSGWLFMSNTCACGTGFVFVACYWVFKLMFATAKQLPSGWVWLWALVPWVIVFPLSRWLLPAKPRISLFPRMLVLLTRRYS